MKNSNDTNGNRTRDLLTCSAVPQPTAPPRAPNEDSKERKLEMLKKKELATNLFSMTTIFLEIDFLVYFGGTLEIQILLTHSHVFLHWAERRFKTEAVLILFLWYSDNLERFNPASCHAKTSQAVTAFCTSLVFKCRPHDPLGSNFLNNNRERKKSPDVASRLVLCMT